ncbi:MAG: hypothetical protein WDW38_007181 [Sanguina aurantia]
MDSDRIFIDDQGQRRLKDTEFVLPVIVGTCAFFLGKKQAADYNTHRWTVYIRSPTDEDLSHIFSKVSFELHNTFAVPLRVLDAHPLEVTEQGWGQFDIVVTFHFHVDCGDKPVVITHHLKLFENGEQTIPQNTKKPVISETTEQLVFSEPREAFFTRITNQAPRLAAPLSVQSHLFNQDEAADLARLKECRSRVAAMVTEMRREFESRGTA